MGWKLGMQVREMTALTWDQVDLDRGLVRLPVTVGLMLLVWGRDTGTVGLFGAVVMVVQLAVLLLSVAVVENALKRTFGEER